MRKGQAKLYDAHSIGATIHVIRNTRVILDADLARFYGVDTRKLNQAVKRHADRFPIGFAKEKKAGYRSRKTSSQRCV